MTTVDLSKTNSNGLMTGEFYVGIAGEFAAGFDGMGAIDMERSDIVRTVTKWMREQPFLEEITLEAGHTAPNIYMRRAVREFDLLYDYRFNTLAVSQDFFEKFRRNIEPSLRGIKPVSCHFGTRTRPYMFGNLSCHRCLSDKVDWKNSTFKIADHSKFDINRTKIGRGEFPFEHEITYCAEGLILSDMSAYYSARRVTQTVIPERLTLEMGPCEIISLGVGQTLFSVDLVNALRDRKRAKTKISGMAFSHPKIPVTFV